MDNDKAKKALRLAKGVMEYCQGDAWERECTEEDRRHFEELYFELIPEDLPPPPPKVPYCSICDRTFQDEHNLKQHLAGNKHQKVALRKEVIISTTTGFIPVACN